MSIGVPVCGNTMVFLRIVAKDLFVYINEADSLQEFSLMWPLTVKDWTIDLHSQMQSLLSLKALKSLVGLRDLISTCIYSPYFMHLPWIYTVLAYPIFPNGYNLPCPQTFALLGPSIWRAVSPGLLGKFTPKAVIGNVQRVFCVSSTV